jgi:hypothetical protein
VRPLSKRPLLFAAGLYALLLASGALAVLILPGPLRPFHYMLAGTLAVFLAMAAFFIAMALRRPTAVSRLWRSRHKGH